MTLLHSRGHLNASELQPVSRGRGWDIVGNYVTVIVGSIFRRTKCRRVRLENRVVDRVNGWQQDLLGHCWWPTSHEYAFHILTGNLKFN
ncbi:hypothetical protein P692DRAFT_20290401 [Suillus brevipes Sb2]|nr:hypothetical protein P692DRAFT_20290401 [Suillus brevipes Sb2]